MTAPAIYLGMQPGYQHLPAIELFNLLAPVGEFPTGSTVSRRTLEAHGYTVRPRQTGIAPPQSRCTVGTRSRSRAFARTA